MSKQFNNLIDSHDLSDDNVMIVDCMNLSFRSTDSASFMRTVNSLAKTYDCGQVILANDGGSKYCRNLLPTYKQNRRDKVEKMTEEELAERQEFFTEFKDMMVKVEEFFDVFQYKGAEADHIAGYLVSRLKPHVNSIVLISTDSDWDLLLDSNVMRFSFNTRKEYTLDNFYDEHGCDTPEQFLSMKVLKGGKDNVKGAEGVGPKRAYNLIREYGSAYDIADILPIEDPRKFVQSLNAFGADEIYRNYALLDLVSFSWDALDFVEADLDPINKHINDIIAMAR